MVITAGNGTSNPSPNPRQGCFCFRVDHEEIAGASQSDGFVTYLGLMLQEGVLPICRHALGVLLPLPTGLKSWFKKSW